MDRRSRGLRAVFLGTPHGAVASLEALLASGFEVPLVVTRADRPAGRSAAPQPPPVKDAAARHGIPVVQPNSVKEIAFLDLLKSARADLMVVVAYGKILPPAVLDLPPLGAVNVHFSLLPRYRGAAPVQWALARRETVTGVTAMRINERLDEGDILRQVEVRIEPREHAPALLDRLSRAGARLLVETLDAIERGEITSRPQDPAEASYAPLLRREDGEADFSLSAIEIEGRVRGFDPWPGVWARREARRLRLVETRAIDRRAATEPGGTVLHFEAGALLVACGGETVLAVEAVQPDGRRVMTAREAMNGRHLLPGDRLS